MHDMIIATFDSALDGGAIGLVLTNDRRRPGELTGSVDGTVDYNCDVIRNWGAAAVLSLTAPDVDPISLPLEDFARAVRARHMHWYHVPVRVNGLPGLQFEADWREAGADLRRIARNGFRVIVHGEGEIGRSAMIVGRLLVELGRDPRQAIHDLRNCHANILPGTTMAGHVLEARYAPAEQPERTPTAIRDRAVGALLGLAAGDAVGTTLEFKPRDSYDHITDMVGGGPFRLRPGEWTDDTAMALALAETLAEHDQHDDWEHRQELIRHAHASYFAGKQNRLARERRDKRIREAQAGEYPDNPRLFERALMERFTAWSERGDYSCNGRCFDIGMTVNAALTRWKRTGNPVAGSPDPMSAGNGSLMRLAPVAIRYWQDRERLRDYAARQSRTTHAAAEAVDACVAYAELLADAIAGERTMDFVLEPQRLAKVAGYDHWSWRPKLYAENIEAVLSGSWRGKARSDIRASGYVVHSLEAALWSVGRSASFRDAVLTAANLGEDADTTAAIAGQLAGALYGASGIPQAWRDKLAWHDRIVACAEALLTEDMRDAH
jgi:ADP-ribosyl-[dinitrogen reductase] hydrolase